MTLVTILYVLCALLLFYSNNKANIVHHLSKCATPGKSQRYTRVSVLTIKVKGGATYHVSHAVMRMFLIDVTISKVSTPVNHREVQEHWLSLTRGA